jgi:hypothetical protein
MGVLIGAGRIAIDRPGGEKKRPRKRSAKAESHEKSVPLDGNVFFTRF